MMVYPAYDTSHGPTQATDVPARSASDPQRSEAPGMLAKGDKLLVVWRGLYPGETVRHGCGTVEGLSGHLLRFRCYFFRLDQRTAQFVRRPDERDMALSLEQPGVLVFVLPRDTVLSKLSYIRTPHGRRVLTDQTSFSWDMSG